jgi:hypothetical protein
MATTTFTYENCELDFGSYSLGGDWTLTIETQDDGFSFKLIDADSLGNGVSKTAFALIQEWIDDDTAPRARNSEHKSSIHRAYSNHIAARTADDEADDRGCNDFHQRAA